MLSKATAAQEFTRDVIDRAKQATVLVVTDANRKLGTAACIDPAGYFLTLRSIVNSANLEPLKLMLEDNAGNQREVQVDLVPSDMQNSSLALLKAKEQATYHSFKLEQSQRLQLHQTVASLGFLTRQLFETEGRPIVKFSVAQLGWLGSSADGLEWIRFGEGGPICEGGPVINTSGELIAIASSLPPSIGSGVIENAKYGVLSALTGNSINRFLASPVVQFELPQLAINELQSETEIVIRARPLLGAETEYQLQMQLGEGEDQVRQFPVQRIGPDQYRVRVIPVSQPNTPLALLVEVALNNSDVRGRLTDAQLFRSGATLNARQIRRSEDQWIITYRDGTEAEIRKFPVDQLEVSIAGTSVKLDVSAINSLSLLTPPEEIAPAFIPLKLTVMSAGKTLATINKLWAVGRSNPFVSASPVDQTTLLNNNSFAAAEHLSTSPAQTVRLETTFTLPLAYSNCIQAGAGRYLAFHLLEGKKIAIFDILTGVIVHEIENVVDDVLLAAGKEKLFLIYPGHQVMQRWSLVSFERESVAGLPGSGPTLAAMMGCAGNGPLILTSNVNTVIDVDSMSPNERLSIPAPNRDVNMAISNNGRVLGLSGRSFHKLKLESHSISLKDFQGTDSSGQWVMPSADGTLMFTSRGIIDPHLKRISASWLDDDFLFPTVDARYFLALRLVPGSTQEPNIEVKLCTTCDRNIICKFAGLPQLASSLIGKHWPEGNHPFYPGGYQRLYYVPSAKLIVTLPPSNTEVILTQFDPLRELQNKHEKYLFIDSIPPSEIYVGQRVYYQIAAHTDDSSLTYSLETGPPGMTVSAKGVIAWNVPVGYSSPMTQVIVIVANGTNREIMHSFNLELIERPNQVSNVK